MPIATLADYRAVPSSHTITQQDLDFLELLCSDSLPQSKQKRASEPASAPARRPAIDPLILALASSASTTQNHYHHDFYPALDPARSSPVVGRVRVVGDWYQSQQKPRRERLKELEAKAKESGKESGKENGTARPRPPSSPPSQLPTIGQRTVSTRSDPQSSAPSPSTATPSSASSSALPTSTAHSTAPSLPPLEIRCEARTRVPTPHGQVFLHLYKNNRDSKEHLALVIDPEQLENPSRHSIRSRSLDAVWHEGETELERLTRGAYVGRIRPGQAVASRPHEEMTKDYIADEEDAVPPLVRIHSECYTGETIGSMRCDCGEQLDEALRLMFVPAPAPRAGAARPPPRGVIVYMRQEGRGIGLAAKLRAYNLQDMGHDTVNANLLLGFGADERSYEIAAAILRDLGAGEGVRLMTNNPEKVDAMEQEGVRVLDRVAMVPRAWKCNHDGVPAVRKMKTSRKLFDNGGEQTPSEVVAVAQGNGSSSLSRAGSDVDDDAADDDADEYESHLLRRSGATLIGGDAARGEELERYLRTKIERMGHMLELPPSQSGARQ